MSAYIYDNAIVDNLRSLTNDNRIYITPVDNVVRTVSLVDKDNVKLPMISITRTGIVIQQDKQSQFMRFEGSLAGYNDSTNKLKRAQAVPIRINYLVDIWTKSREDNDNITRELIFYILTHPTMSVKVPYGLDIEHNFNVYLDNDVEDNSDIVEHKNRGEYFRQTLSMYTDDAYLWKSSSRYPTYVDTSVEIVSSHEGEK